MSNATVRFHNTQEPHLTAADRCDRCGAQAVLRVVMHTGDLLFCGHHSRVYHNTLVRDALQVLDGSTSVSLLTGFTPAELAELGGIPEEGSS